MGKDLTTTAAPAHPALAGNAAKQLQEEAKALAERIGAESASLVIKGDKKGNIIIGDDKAESAQLVVIDFITERRFYDSGYVDGADYRPPTCYGIARNPDKMVPHANVKEIGGEPQSDTCANCPMNEWESDPINHKGKACKERRVMLVLPPGEDHVDDDFWEFACGVSSLKNFDNMVRDVNKMWGLPPIGAEITLCQDDNFDYQVYMFEDPQPNHDLEAHFERMPQARQILESRKYDAASEEDKPVRRAKKKTARKKTAARGRGK